MTSQLLSPVTRPETSEVILDPISVLIAILNGPPSLSFLHFSIAQSHLFVSVCTITSISAAAPPLTGDVSVMVQPEKQIHWGVLQGIGLCSCLLLCVVEAGSTVPLRLSLYLMLEPEVYRTGVLKEIDVKCGEEGRLEHMSMSWKPISILLPLTLVRRVSCRCWSFVTVIWNDLHEN